LIIGAITVLWEAFASVFHPNTQAPSVIAGVVIVKDLEKLDAAFCWTFSGHQEKVSVSLD